MERISSSRCFGGEQMVWKHQSRALSCDMRVAVFTPPREKHGAGPYPTLYWLSGLTCTEDNFTVKAGAQRVAAELGMMIVAPDTSPRGDDVPDLEPKTYDFGKGAGFYLDATQAPWARQYRMYSYIVDELPKLVAENFPADAARTGIFGHSMGGHGALTIHLKNPDKFRSCSAFAPIVAPSLVPWGRKALSNYLGPDEKDWAPYDATRLVADRGASKAHILIDQGTGDQFLAEQLLPEIFAAAAQKAGQKLTLNMRDGYDHSYFFMASFIDDHLRWHQKALA
ncbi:MAG: S-formylglutathione hydrolase [Alphaproteobacteria bacterium RIFCSPHIGHO2_12_FULL_63_12]|nr:MAG: S-formylglutathione hydrolase [Alphaproteobacteria bacterium RIFCSPHIGHO2_12_FULL_63_12]